MALRGKVNHTRIPIREKESFRWLENLRQSARLLADPPRCVHVGDRESDIYELFCTAQEEKTHFVIRTCVDRLAGRGGTTISKKMRRQPVRGEHEIEVRDDRRRSSTAKLDLRFCRMTVHPPISKHKHYPVLSLTVIHAEERSAPVERAPIRWKLLTNLPVDDFSAAIQKLDWYTQRWKIETFHKSLKSGGKAEESKLRTAARLTNSLAVFCIIGWRVFSLTMTNRTTPNAPAEVAFTRTEIRLLDRITGDAEKKGKQSHTIYLTAVSKLSGYLARGADPPPGNIVLWRGMTRLTDMHLGFELQKVVGN